MKPSKNKRQNKKQMLHDSWVLVACHGHQECLNSNDADWVTEECIWCGTMGVLEVPSCAMHQWQDKFIKREMRSEIIGDEMQDLEG